MVRLRWSLQQVRVYNDRDKLSDNDVKQHGAKEKHTLSGNYIQKKLRTALMRRKQTQNPFPRILGSMKNHFLLQNTNCSNIIE